MTTYFFNFNRVISTSTIFNYLISINDSKNFFVNACMANYKIICFINEG